MFVCEWNIFHGKLLEQKNLLDNSLKGKIKKKEITRRELVFDGLVFYEWEEDLFGRTSNAVIFSESLLPSHGDSTHEKICEEDLVLYQLESYPIYTKINILPLTYKYLVNVTFYQLISVIYCFSLIFQEIFNKFFRQLFLITSFKILLCYPVLFWLTS